MNQILYKIPIIRTWLRQYRLAAFRKTWRRQNPHNRTVAINEFPLNSVKVGKETYGELHILNYLPQLDQVVIGNFVSLAPGVTFIPGGNHTTDALFTYPLKSAFTGHHCAEDARSKGAIVVEDEAWIGYGSIILSGVTIGKGSIVAAGSVVTRSVPPYAIVAGNPAKVVRYRLPQDVITTVAEVRLADIPTAQLQANLDALYTPLQSAQQARTIIEKLTGHERE